MNIQDVLQQYKGDATAGLAYEILTAQRLENEKALERYGFKVYSQNDEDGIIEEIFNRIGTTNKIFIEFGVENGLECNGHYLLHKGWKGLWLDGSEQHCAEINEKFYPVLRTGQLKCRRAFITKDNINRLIADAGFGGEIDLLSIDIDGNDYYVWRAINVVKPRVVVIEYNAKFPPNHVWRMAYNEKHLWDGSDWQGASLKALENLGRELGYRLVGTNYRGVNAFFVRQELAGEHFLEPATSEYLYNPARYKHIHFFSGHRPRYCMHNQFSNIGLLNYMPEKFEKFLDDRSRNFLDDEIQARARVKFDLLPDDKIHHPTRTHSMFYLPNGDIDLIQQIILLTDDYHEADVLKTFAAGFGDIVPKQLLGAEGSVVVDAGAGIGNRLMYFANELRAERLIAFEPIESTFAILKKNVAINNLDARSELHCKGLSAVEGRTSIRKFNPANMGETLLVGDDGDIELTTLDALELPKLTLLNIDASDMELQILQGARETIKRTCPIVLVKSFPYIYPEVEEFFYSLSYAPEQISKNDYVFRAKD